MPYFPFETQPPELDLLLAEPLPNVHQLSLQVVARADLALSWPMLSVGRGLDKALDVPGSALGSLLSGETSMWPASSSLCYVLYFSLIFLVWMVCLQCTNPFRLHFKRSPFLKFVLLFS